MTTNRFHRKKTKFDNFSPRIHTGTYYIPSVNNQCCRNLSTVTTSPSKFSLNMKRKLGEEISESYPVSPQGSALEPACQTVHILPKIRTGFFHRKFHAKSSADDSISLYLLPPIGRSFLVRNLDETHPNMKIF